MAQPKQKCVVSHGFGWGIYCNYLNCFCLCGFPGYVAFLTGCEASCEILEMVYFASCSMCFSLLFFFHVFVRLCYEMWFMDIHGSPTFEKTKNKLAQADFCLSRATVVDLEKTSFHKNNSSLQDTYRLHICRTTPRMLSRHHQDFETFFSVRESQPKRNPSNFATRHWHRCGVRSNLLGLLLGRWEFL